VADEGLFRRVAITSLVVTVIVYLALAARLPWTVGVSFVLGAALGLASLAALDAWTRSLVPAEPASQQRRLLTATALNIGKYGLLGAGLYLLFAHGLANVPALAGGFTVPTLVLCLKAVGRTANRGLNAGKGPPANSRETAPEFQKPTNGGPAGQD
jgi:hypothetical protein